MRTTITLADDVAAAVEALRDEESVGMSEAVNRLARRGLRTPEPAPRFEQVTSSMGPPRLPLDDIGEALAVLEGDSAG